MSFFDRIENALRARYGETPTAGQPGQPAPGSTLPPGVYVQQAPRQRTSRATLLLVGGVVLLALYFVWSAAHTTAPVPKKQAEYPGADIDKNGISRVMESLKSDAQKVQRAKELADRQLREQEALLQAQQSTAGNPGVSGMPGLAGMAGAQMQSGTPTSNPTAAQVIDPLAEDRKKKAYTSLFSNPIIKLPSEPESRGKDRPQQEANDPALLANRQGGQISVPVAPALPAAPSTADVTNPATSKPEQPHNCLDQVQNERTGALYAICEGSILEARLANRLVGDFSGPVIAIAERDQYSRDRQHLLIPKGSRLLGDAERTTNSFANRLSVSFHRLILPDGSGRDLNSPGLDAAGATALKDKTDYHLKSTVLTTVVLGALAGFATAGTGGFYTGTGVDAYRQSLSQQAGQTGQQLIGRTLNRPPTITIREGQPVLIYVREDFHLPEYGPSVELQSR